MSMHSRLTTAQKIKRDISLISIENTLISTLRQKSKQTKQRKNKVNTKRKKRRKQFTKKISSSIVKERKCKFDENCLCNLEKDQATKSIQEDALVHGAEEGRDKLRKATGSCK